MRVEVFGALAFAGSLGGSAESFCPDGCSSHSSPHGFLVGARGSYVLPSRLRVEVSAGFLRVAPSIERTVPGGSDYFYSLHDSLVVGGPFVSAGMGYGLPLGDVFQLTGRVAVGAFFVRSSDSVTGLVSRAGDAPLPVDIDHAGGGVRAVDVFVLPALGGELHFGRFQLGASLGAGIFLADGPTLPNGEVVVQAVCPQGAATTVVPLGCVRGSRAVSAENAYQRFVLWIPEISVGTTF